MKPKILNSSERLRTLQKEHQQQAFLLPEGFDGKKSFELRPIALRFSVLP